MNTGARAWIALLLVWLLPLQCVQAAVLSMAMPAHVHVLEALVTAQAPPVQHPTRADQVIGVLDGAAIVNADAPSQAGVAPHAHRFGMAGVVYLDQDAAGTGTRGGRNATLVLDMLLPQWRLPASPLLAAAALPTQPQANLTWPQPRTERPPRSFLPGDTAGAG